VAIRQSALRLGALAKDPSKPKTTMAAPKKKTAVLFYFRRISASSNLLTARIIQAISLPGLPQVVGLDSALLVFITRTFTQAPSMLPPRSDAKPQLDIARAKFNIRVQQPMKDTPEVGAVAKEEFSPTRMAGTVMPWILMRKMVVQQISNRY